MHSYNRYRPYAPQTSILSHFAGNVHEFVTQTHLTRGLTLKLLQVNKNPDFLAAAKGVICPAALVSSPADAGASGASSAIVGGGQQLGLAAKTKCILGKTDLNVKDKTLVGNLISLIKLLISANR
ncbi:unnamed protein product [Protopolystoma xenopodis]|uniref:Uncharacterized protein n=1 Tax=Protopolystoma xenopodis TaxID=117903 RepID=A0A448WBU3_9PLAT|nr:unnamed protein product [Protopolystoma xenopodis]